ncbi:MAG: hypothetical protein ACLFR0_05280 [Alphaproteobacteria bacterium]
MADTENFTDENFQALATREDSLRASDAFTGVLNDLDAGNFSLAHEAAGFNAQSYIQNIADRTLSGRYTLEDIIGALIANDFAGFNQALALNDEQINTALTDIINFADNTYPGIASFLQANHEPYANLLARQHITELDSIVAERIGDFESGHIDVTDYLQRLSNLDFTEERADRLKEILLHDEGQLARYFASQDSELINLYLTWLFEKLGENDPDFITGIRDLSPELDRIGFMAAIDVLSPEDLLAFDSQNDDLLGWQKILDNRGEEDWRTYITEALENDHGAALLNNELFSQLILNSEHFYAIADMFAGAESEDIQNTLTRILEIKDTLDPSFIEKVMETYPDLESFVREHIPAYGQSELEEAPETGTLDSAPEGEPEGEGAELRPEEAAPVEEPPAEEPPPRPAIMDGLVRPVIPEREIEDNAQTLEEDVTTQSPDESIPAPEYSLQTPSEPRDPGHASTYGIPDDTIATPPPAEPVVQPEPEPVVQPEPEAEPEPELETTPPPSTAELLNENSASLTSPRFSEFLDGRGYHNDSDGYTDYDAIREVFQLCEELGISNANITAIQEHIGQQENMILKTEPAIRALNARNEILENGGDEVAAVAAFFDQLTAEDFVPDLQNSIDDTSVYDKGERDATYQQALRFDS